jgi:hypothetical protein
MKVCSPREGRHSSYFSFVPKRDVLTWLHLPTHTKPDDHHSCAYSRNPMDMMAQD